MQLGRVPEPDVTVEVPFLVMAQVRRGDLSILEALEHGRVDGKLGPLGLLAGISESPEFHRAELACGASGLALGNLGVALAGPAHQAALASWRSARLEQARTALNSEERAFRRRRTRAFLEREIDEGLFSRGAQVHVAVDGRARARLSRSAAPASVTTSTTGDDLQGVLLDQAGGDAGGGASRRRWRVDLDEPLQAALPGVPGAGARRRDAFATCSPTRPACSTRRR